MRSIIFLLGTLLTSSLPAATIVSVSGNPDSSYQLGGSASIFPQSIGASWSLASAYSDVSLKATIINFSDVLDFDVDFFLTTQIGPGTTNGSEIARSKVNIPANNPNGIEITVFDQLKLGPGTYYLTASGPVFALISIYWPFSNSPTVTLGPGATLGNSYVGLGVTAQNSYPPEGTSKLIDPNLPPFFTVTGTAVPEPGSISLACIGILGILVRAQAAWRSDSRYPKS